MSDDYRDWVLNKAIDEWGEDAQLDMAIEEMSELITALQHRRRERISDDDVAEEIADVKILIRQLELMFDEDKVDDEYWDKITRLEHRLEAGEEL